MTDRSVRWRVNGRDADPPETVEEIFRQIDRSVHAIRLTEWDSGVKEGIARSILAVLEVRGITVPKTSRDRISDKADRGDLHTWIQRAAFVETAEDLFA
ncbi:hypothetical protein [Nocardia donostiensis]|uniref:hypothetical protein n=1 Tax=Nocardia donostiensis TaxID=1538463 RepID=UPI0011157AE5|nr:hypothetical protein [Nocardia donostiensis]